MASMCMKRCSTSLAFRAMQIKTTRDTTNTPTRMATVKKTDKEAEKLELIHCRWEYKMVQLFKNGLAVS